MTTTAPTDMLLSEAIESECRRVMAGRAGLKRQPGTHGQQAELMTEVDADLDRYNMLMLGR